MCTLTTLNLNGGGKKQKGGKKDKKSKDVENEVVLAMPVNSKLPWMGLDSVPKEFHEDKEEGRKIGQRYYIAEFKEWTET